MRIEIIILLSIMFSCSTLSNKKLNESEICREDIVIEQNEVISEIESLVLNRDFYLEGESQYFMFEIHLNDKLRIKEVKLVFENNPQYTDQIMELISKLSFKKIDDHKKCQEYVLPFIVNARLKRLKYPKDKMFYDVDLPID